MGPPAEDAAARGKPTKLPRLPKHARIQKRPLNHPAIPSPHTSASTQKVIYIATRTPFAAAVKRVRKFLAHIEDRASASSRTSTKTGRKGKDEEEVVLKAASRAIERALGLAVFFQGQPDVRVRLRTGSVAVVDDIIEGPREATKGGDLAMAEGKVGGGDAAEADGKDGAHAEGEDDLPETRVRKTSVLEVLITLR
ncbi:MAG: hypothetical protein M1832_006287 [Thelocarpon impressellum]|nr:MAG: hypothetical protein M1832_006287 [Thelocarpon impressellum]